MLAAVRDGQIVHRASMFGLMAVRRARADGIPVHLVAHEDFTGPSPLIRTGSGLNPGRHAVAAHHLTGPVAGPAVVRTSDTHH